MHIRKKSEDRVWKKAKRGFRGYPILTVSYYGPDDTHATKVAVGLQRAEDIEVEIIERIFTTSADARHDLSIRKRVLTLMEEHAAATVAMSKAIMGCPHDEGVDYAEGTSCPRCPAWDGVNPLAAARAQLLAEALMRQLHRDGETE